LGVRNFDTGVGASFGIIVVRISFCFWYFALSILLFILSKSDSNSTTLPVALLGGGVDDGGGLSAGRPCPFLF